MSELKSADDNFENLKSKAAAKGKVLCYIAKYENGKAKVEIEEIGKEHPFFGLNGNDNIVSIKTKFNNEKPLTLSGRGAGARYTASGVLSDILRISNSAG
jgi:bifunctional aspartokinase / homoserine dehydrogenase 1